MDPNLNTNAPERFPQSQAPNEIEETKKRSKKLLLIISVILAILIPVGIFAYSQHKSSVSYETTIAPTPVAKPTATPDPTMGWQTYTSTASGFSFKYPPDWTASQSANGASISKKVFQNPPNSVEPAGENAEIDIKFQSNDQNFIPQTWLSNEVSQRGIGADFKPQIKNLTVGGETAIQTLLPSKNGENWIVFVHGNMLFTIFYENSTDEAEKAVSQILSPLLSTFKFTSGASQTNSDLSTYTSTMEPTLSFQYPSSWTLGNSSAATHESITLTSKSGSQVSFQDAGLGGNFNGGACSAQSTNTINSVVPLLNAKGLSLADITIQAKSGPIESIGIVEGTPKVGSVNDCDTPKMIFSSKSNSNIQLTFGTGNLNSADKNEAIQILKSLKY